jgi:hypothetical protein
MNHNELLRSWIRINDAIAQGASQKLMKEKAAHIQLFEDAHATPALLRLNHVTDARSPAEARHHAERGRATLLSLITGEQDGTKAKVNRTSKARKATQQKADLGAQRAPACA